MCDLERAVLLADCFEGIETLDKQHLLIAREVIRELSEVNNGDCYLGCETEEMETKNHPIEVNEDLHFCESRNGRKTRRIKEGSRIPREWLYNQPEGERGASMGIISPRL